MSSLEAVTQKATFEPKNQGRKYGKKRRTMKWEYCSGMYTLRNKLNKLTDAHKDYNKLAESYSKVGHISNSITIEPLIREAEIVSSYMVRGS